MFGRSLVNAIASKLIALSIFVGGYYGTIEQVSSGLGKLYVAAMAGAGIVAFAIFASTNRLNPTLVWALCGGAMMITLQVFSVVFGAPQGRIDMSELVQMAGQLLLAVLWFGFCSVVDWQRDSVRRSILVIGNIVLGLNVLVWIATGFGKGDLGFSGLAVQKNGLAGVGALGVAFGCFYLKRFTKEGLSLWAICMVILGLAVLRASGGRATQGLVLITAFVFWLNLAFSRSLFLRQTTFGILVYTLYLIPVTYVNIDQSTWFQQIEQNSIKYYDHSILSGREALWPVLIDEIKSRPAFGWGTCYPLEFERHVSNQPAMILSAHNLYLSTAYRSGLVGLGGMLFFFWTIWTSYYHHQHNYWLRVSAACFVGIILRETTEVTLTHNGLDVMLGEWAIVAAGFGVTTPDVEEELPAEEELPDNEE